MNSEKPVRLERKTTWDEWERGRAARLAVCDEVTAFRQLRRLSGDPRKDELLRRLNSGERGPRFQPIAPLRPEPTPPSD